MQGTIPVHSRGQGCVGASCRGCQAARLPGCPTQTTPGTEWFGCAFAVESTDGFGLL